MIAISEGEQIARLCDSVYGLGINPLFLAAANKVIRHPKYNFRLRHCTDLINRTRKQTLQINSFKQFIYFMVFIKAHNLNVTHPFWLPMKDDAIYLLRDTTIQDSEEFTADSLVTCNYPNAYFFC